MTFIRIFLLKTFWSVRLLVRGNKFWTKVLLRSLRYWRVAEFPFVLENLPSEKGLRFLDISSPKILACDIARRTHNEVVAIDIWEKEITMWNSVIGDVWKPGFPQPPKLETEDATRLSYPDESFDAVFSVSVLEHIDARGDTAAMTEIARVLRKGGTAIVSVMFDRKGYDVWKNEAVYHKDYSAGSVFYERWYNVDQLQERLIQPSGLKLVKISFAAERYYRVHKKILDRLINSHFFIANSWSILEPFVGLLNIRRIDDASEVVEGIALLVLRKR